MSALALLLCLLIFNQGAGQAIPTDSTAARELYHRRTTFFDWATLVSVVELQQEITAVQVVSLEHCRKAPICSGGGGLALVGDAGGGITAWSPQHGILWQSSLDAAENEAPGMTITAIASFAQPDGSLAVLAVYANGALSWRSLHWPKTSSRETRQEITLPAVFAAEAGVAAGKEGTPPWVSLDAAALRGRKIKGGGIGAALAGADGSGRVALGTLDPGGVLHLDWTADNASCSPFSSPFVRLPSAPASRGARYAQVLSAHGEAAHVVHKRKESGAHVAGALQTCEGWTSSDASSFEIGNLTAVAAEGHGARLFGATSTGRLVALYLRQRHGGQQHCRLLGSHPLETPLASVSAIAVLPGYVLAISGGSLAIHNVSGAFARPQLTPLLRQPLAELVAAIPGQPSTVLSNLMKLRAPKASNIPSQPLMAAAGVPAGIPAAGQGSTNGVVLLQLSPRTAALYATAFPHTPPRRPNEHKGVNWIGALQPFIIAGVVGVAMHRSKSRGRSDIAARMLASKSRLEFGGAPPGRAGRYYGVGGTAMPWEEREEIVEEDAGGMGSRGGWDGAAFERRLLEGLGGERGSPVARAFNCVVDRTPPVPGYVASSLGGVGSCSDSEYDGMSAEELARVLRAGETLEAEGAASPYRGDNFTSGVVSRRRNQPQQQY